MLAECRYGQDLLQSHHLSGNYNHSSYQWWCVSVVRAEEWSGIRLVVVLGITPSIVTINANHKEKREVAEVSVVSAALMVQAV